ncbi:hypothetical protein P5P86_14065 [Nocardioides sp. BP30]|uniref:TetR/AcrR family transcriptional regulator n=1 Tax=Nocardioides sp. BP30 TaxID=3036374 RepID=UPI00246846EB|nr:hypothetical protein [Nocardioides sp. BP30]WGL51087.1 hypothetical protein P5P86_14065 [Nocardioides sp. BP30]
MDPRQRRSRERLHRAILRLATDSPVADLSVTTVATAAGVHRSTFYQHASSPATLLEQALLEELDALRAGLVAPDGDVAAAVTAVTEGVLRHIEAHLEIYRRGLGEDSGEASLRPMLSQHFRESGHHLINQPGAGLEVRVSGLTRQAITDAATRFIADGTVGLLVGWVQEPRPRVDRFLHVYTALLPDWWPGSRRSTPQCDS